MSQLDLISFGESMVEFFAEQPLADALVFQKAYGGDAMNVLVAAARLGARGGFISKVGDDPFARYLRAEWQREGLDLTHAPVVPGFNAVYFITVLEGGQREFTYYRAGSAASTFRAEELPLAALTTAKAFYTSGITQALGPNCRAAVLAAVRAARAAGVFVAFDPNLRLKLWTLAEARAAFAEVLPYTDAVLISGPEESRTLLELDDPVEIAASLHARGVRIVGVKQGERGCTVSTEGRCEQVPALPVAVVDTTGAGDAFNGAFLYGMTQGWDAIASARLGVVHASLKCRGRGAVASLPARDETYAAAQLRSL